MNLNYFLKPAPLYADLILLGIFSWRCIYTKHLPGVDKLIEILVIGFTFYQASLLVKQGWVSCGTDNDNAFGLFLGGLAIAYVSLKQVMYLFERMEPYPEIAGPTVKYTKKRKRRGGA